MVFLLTWPVGSQAKTFTYTHEVLPGETIVEIAKRYHLTPRKLRQVSRLKSDSLRAGQKLKIQTSLPSQSRIRTRYLVKSGDNLVRVAKAHKMSLAQLRRLNPRAKGALQPGQRLWVVVEIQPPRGKDRDFYCLESGPGFMVLEPQRSFGTMLTVTRVTEVLSAHHVEYPFSPPIVVGDLSRRGGGFLAPHRSHRRGRDVDIRYPLKHPETRYVPATSATLDVERTWKLIQAFLKTKDVTYIFVDRKLQKVLYEHAKKKGIAAERLAELFQYPRRAGAMVGIIRHENGHATHLHVRFRSVPIAAEPNT